MAAGVDESRATRLHDASRRRRAAGDERVPHFVPRSCPQQWARAVTGTRHTDDRRLEQATPASQPPDLADAIRPRLGRGRVATDGPSRPPADTRTAGQGPYR